MLPGPLSKVAWCHVSSPLCIPGVTCTWSRESELCRLCPGQTALVKAALEANVLVEKPACSRRSICRHMVAVAASSYSAPAAKIQPSSNHTSAQDESIRSLQNTSLMDELRFVQCFPHAPQRFEPVHQSIPDKMKTSCTPLLNNMKHVLDQGEQVCGQGTSMSQHGVLSSSFCSTFVHESLVQGHCGLIESEVCL